MRLVLSSAILAFSMQPATAAESTYTKFSFERDCMEMSTDEAGGAWRCEGLPGYDIHLAEGDLRQSVFYGEVGDWHEAGAWESFGPFNSAGETIEWRLEDGKPFATIRRWTIEHPGPDGEPTPASRGQVLVVSKVGQPSVGDACVVGYVDARANADANEIAREVADTLATDFSCRNEDPRWHGKRGPAAADPVRSFGG